MKKAVKILILSAFLLTFTVTKQVNAMQDTQEIWKDVVGYEGLYSVSNYGSVKNIKGNIKVPHLRKEYFSVILYNNGKWKNNPIHRLVAKHFIPNPNDYSQVNHKDGNKLNNHYLNLEWCSPKHNIHHAINNNLRHPAVGEAYSKAKLTEDKVRKIRLMSEHMTHQAIANEFGVAQSFITKVVNRQNWKHVI